MPRCRGSVANLHDIGIVHGVYRLVTGADYADFSIDKEEMLRQSVDTAPLPFTRHGRPPWPALESLLGSALAKDPHHRLPSVREFGERMAALPRPARASGPRVAGTIQPLELVLEEVVARARPGGGWFEQGLPATPSSSVV